MESSNLSLVRSSSSSSLFSPDDGHAVIIALAKANNKRVKSNVYCLEVDGDFQNGEGYVLGSPFRLHNEDNHCVWVNHWLRERHLQVGSIISYKRCSNGDVRYFDNTGVEMKTNKIISQLQFGDGNYGGFAYRGIQDAFPGARVFHHGISHQDNSSIAEFALVSIKSAYIQDERIVFTTQLKEECNLKMNCRTCQQYSINVVHLPVQSRSSEEEVGDVILINMARSIDSAQGVCEGVLIGTPESLGSYEMNVYSRGICLIINNFRFQNEADNRKGSEHDVNELDDLFQQLSFTVDVRENLKRDEMQRVVIEYANIDHTQYCAFVMIVMSHGSNRDVIYGVDGRYVTLEAIMSEFQATNCPSLDGKPKVFIIQACRGSNDNLPLPSEACVDRFGISTDSTLPIGTCAREADFLLASASVPGYEAKRDKNKGSFFIQALVETIRKRRQDHHLLDMLTEVTRVVVDRTVAWGLKPQVPAPSYTLRRQLWLKDVDRDDKKSKTV